MIHSDESPAYGNLNVMGCHHLTVNHQEHYVDPVIGTRTKTIERSWLDIKTSFLKKMRSISSEIFQSHFDHICWKVLRKDAADLFGASPNDIR